MLLYVGLHVLCTLTHAHAHLHTLARAHTHTHTDQLIHILSPIIMFGVALYPCSCKTLKIRASQPNNNN